MLFRFPFLKIEITSIFILDKTICETTMMKSILRVPCYGIEYIPNTQLSVK